MRNLSRQWSAGGWLGLALGVLLIVAASGRGQLPESRPVDDLRRVLQGPERDPAVREHQLQECLANLRDLAELREALALSNWFGEDLNPQMAAVDHAAWKAVAERFEQGARALLWHGNATARLAVIQLLSDMGTSVRDARGRGGFAQRFAPDLADVMRQAPPPVQQAAARALGRINPSPNIAVPALAGLLQREDVGVRQAAAEGLWSLLREASELAAHEQPSDAVSLTTDDWVGSCCAALPVCGQGLHDGHPRVRYVCVAAIDQVATALTRLAPDPRAGVSTLDTGHGKQRELAQERERLLPVVLALAQQASTVSALLHDPDPQVRFQVNQCLEALATARTRLGQGGEQLAGVAAGPMPTIQQVNHTTAPSGPDDPLGTNLRATLDGLAAGLKDRNVRVRRTALDGLEALGPGAAPVVPALVRALEDPDLFIRWGAARTLGKIGPSAADLATPALAKMVWDRDFDLGLAATAALTRFGPAARAAVPTLAEALRQGDAERRLAILQALGSIGPDARAAVKEVATRLTDPDPRVRRTAAQVLGRLGPDAHEALDALRHTLTDRDPAVRQAAGGALLQIGEK